jgi:hypothetical protein
MNKEQKILAVASVGLIASFFLFKKSKKLGFSSCPSGMQLYYGTCIPTKNKYAVCPQGYMKETIDGPCVLIPESTSIGGCGAGEEFKMGYRLGDLTATMGCYPIGSTMDINMGSSTGGILGGGAGTNIGGGGTVQGGGGNYSDTSESQYGGKIQTNVTCNENQVYDSILGMCLNKEIPPELIVEELCPDNYTLGDDNFCYENKPRPKPITKKINTITKTPNSSITTSSLSPNTMLFIGGGLLALIIIIKN